MIEHVMGDSRVDSLTHRGLCSLCQQLSWFTGLPLSLISYTDEFNTHSISSYSTGWTGHHWKLVAPNCMVNTKQMDKSSAYSRLYYDCMKLALVAN